MSLQEEVARLNRQAWDYAEQVVSGDIPACGYVRKQCQNALDRRQAVSDGTTTYTYDPQRAVKPALFSKMMCKHLKGPLAGEAIELDAWQLFMVTQIYGWFREDGYRVVRTVYFEVPRKNGKSTICSVLGLYHLFADKEASAEVYSAAKTRDQARIVFGDAQAMVRGSRALLDQLGVHRSNIHHTTSNSKFEPLASDAGSLEGRNPSFSIVDEVHTHPNPEVWDVLAVASGARSQPLQFGITTAGTNREGIAYQLRDYLIKVITAQVEDDSFWGQIYTIDEGDDWTQPSSWAKANPGYGKSVQPDDMERLAKQAGESPSARVNYLTKRLNVWQNASEAWLNMSDWDACGALPRPPMSDWKGQPCYIGLDLASVSDFACVSVLFPRDGLVHQYVQSFLPEDTVYNKGGSMGRAYQQWAEEGRIILTEGNVNDLRYIKEHILRLCETYNVKEIAFDPWGANELSADLIDRGLPMVKVGQGIGSMSGPSKSYEKLVKAGKLIHGDDQVTNWMAGNCEAFYDVNENVKVRKSIEANKIDGIIASIMALGRLEVHGGLRESIYNVRGIRTL
jgi:phage terminase large subunit-like protein